MILEIQAGTRSERSAAWVSGVRAHLRVRRESKLFEGVTGYARKEIFMANTTDSNSLVGRAIEDCLQCLRWCSACVDEGLTDDPSLMAASIRLCHECAPVCRVCATLLSSNSRFAHQLCGVCADICEACASECGQHKHVETMRRCAEACRSCATSCRDVAKAGPLRKAA